MPPQGPASDEGRPAAAAGDDGRPDVRLVDALAADDGSSARRSEVWAALVGARVFLPLAARRHGPTGSAADMSLVLLGSASGARALPVFADGNEVQRWRPEARPVPASGPQACRSALDDGAVALLLDPLGASLVIGGSALTELAVGRVPVAGTGLSTRRVQRDSLVDATPALSVEVRAAVGRALGAEPGVVAARLLHGPDGPVLGLVLNDRPEAAQLAGLAGRVRQRLGGDLPATGLDLAVVDADGPGEPLAIIRPGSGRRWRR